MTKNKKYKLALAAIKHYADLIDIWQKDPKCNSGLMVIKYGTDYSSSFCPYCREFARVIPASVSIGLFVNFPYGYFVPRKWYKYKISRDILHYYVFMKYVFFIIRHPRQRYLNFIDWINERNWFKKGMYKMNCGRCPLNPHMSRNPFFCCGGLWDTMTKNAEKIQYATEIIKYICDHASNYPLPSETQKTESTVSPEPGFWDSLKRDRYGRSDD